MSLKGIDGYRLTKIEDNIEPEQETSNSQRTVADIIREHCPEIEHLESEVNQLESVVRKWKRSFIALVLVFTMSIGGFIFACCNVFATEDDLAAEWEAGYAQGKADGHSLGYDEGFAAGASQSFSAQVEEPVQQEVQEPEPEPEPETTTESSGSEEITVYVTDTGTKYHRSGCGSLWNSSHERSLSQAISQGYGPCGNCNPPVG